MSQVRGSRRRTRRATAIGAVLPVVALVAACSGSPGGGGSDDEAASTEFVTIATGGTGGAYYPIGGAMGNMLAEEIEGVRSGTAETTGGSVENLQLVGQSRSTLGMAMNDAVSNAVNGKGDFEEPQDVCTVAVMYPNLLQMVTTKGANITKLQDLAGKRVSVGDAGSATALMFRNVVESAGMSFDDFGQQQALPFDAQTTAIRNGQLDVGAWVVAPGASSIQDLASSESIQLVQVTDPQLKKISDQYPYYIGQEIEAGTYDGQDEAVQVAGTWNSLLMNTNTNQDFVGEVARAVNENADVLAEGNPAGGETAAKNIENAVAPVCPGAVGYFEEAGVEIPEDLRPE